MIIRLLILLLVLGLTVPSWAVTTPVQHAKATPGDSVTGVSKAFASNVTSGDLLTVCVTRYTGNHAGDPLVVGDLTKIAGTATIGTVVLVTQENANDTNNIFYAAVFSVPATGTGSLTLQVDSADPSNYYEMFLAEWPSTVSATSEASSTNLGTSATIDSGNAASAAGAVFVGCGTSLQDTNTAITQDGAWTLLDEEENGTLHQTGNAAYRSVSTGTTDSGTWTINASFGWAAAIAVFADSAGGGGPTPPAIGTLNLLGVGR
jgi:hypothetical protein